MADTDGLTGNNLAPSTQSLEGIYRIRDILRKSNLGWVPRADNVIA